MKKILCFVLITVVLLSFGGCQVKESISSGKENETAENVGGEGSKTAIASTGEGAEIAIESDFRTSPYRSEGDSIEQVIGKVLSDKYEAYPNLQSVPLSATLYKGGETVRIDLTDPRLIRLINLFNNSLYYEDCEYLLSYLTDEELEGDIANEEFRLELKYEPFGDTYPAPYENMPTQFDTVIVTNSSSEFVLINHSHKITLYDGKESVLAAGYYPLTYPINDISAWLESFGF